MSATCLHLDADAHRHPGCAGCVALLRQLATARTETEHEIRAAAARGEPRQDAERRIADQQAAGLTLRGYLRLDVITERDASGELVQRLASAARPMHDPLTSLLDRAPTPEDAEAGRDEPRPGVWAGEDGADLRRLTQDETDALIRAELLCAASDTEVMDVLAAIGGTVPIPAFSARAPRMQRGGIDSDPLVRVLVRRAWGDRDRQWFELRGVRKGERISQTSICKFPGSLVIWVFVARTWPGEPSLGHALRDGWPGDEIPCETPGGSPSTFRVDDRLREPPDHDASTPSRRVDASRDR
jgi:hypothetical protein